MATVTREPVRFKPRRGDSTEAVADVLRRGEGERAARSGFVLIAAFSLALVSILIPGVHFVAPWALPIVGVVVASYLYKTPTNIGKAAGPCPACREAIEVEGGRVEPDLWVRCPRCQAPFQFELTQGS